jgi:sugar lactone lactonase YvrE
MRIFHQGQRPIFFIKITVPKTNLPRLPHKATIPAMTWQTLTTTPCELGESPFWHPHEQMLYWVDIAAMQVLRMNVFTSSVERWQLAQEPGCIAPARSGGLVLALRDGMYRARQWGGALELLARFDYDSTRTRFNDGKCDPLGRLWAGTLYEPRDQAAAHLYALDARAGRIATHTLAGGTTVANGLAFSPDARTLYWADTSAHRIRAWDLNLNAAPQPLSNERVFKQFAPKPAGWQPGMDGYAGRPDGAAVDAQGHYWVAMFEGQQLLRIAPSGDVLQTVATPTRCPTMPCFGGDDLQTLYLTSARHNRSPAELAAQPQAGCVFAMRVPVPGLPVNFFEDA